MKTMPGPPPEDRDLLGRIAGGDDGAFSVFYQQIALTISTWRGAGSPEALAPSENVTVHHQ